MLLEKLGIYGWNENDENLLLSSLLTGDPLLMIGNRGSAKTYIAQRLAEALNKKFLAYDASKAMFDDVLGYPNVEKLKEGIVEYVSSPVTIWDKEMVLVDEINRAVPELQSKWLEIIRSRKIMGFPTSVSWVWSAMNPISYEATEPLDEALIGRFAIFIFPPDIINMEEEDRINIAKNMNHDDAPALKIWNNKEKKYVDNINNNEINELLNKIMKCASKNFDVLFDNLKTLPEFLSRFAMLLNEESNGKIQLDGRRLGFIYRNILAYRSIEFAKNKYLRNKVVPMKEICSYVIQRSIPFGINDEENNFDEISHIIDNCFNFLESYFEESSNMEMINKIYELFTVNDLVRKLEIIIENKNNLSDLIKYKIWNKLIDNDEDNSHMLYVAMVLETIDKNLIPIELIDPLSKQINLKNINEIDDYFTPIIDILSDALYKTNNLELLISKYHVLKFMESKSVNREEAKQIEEKIQYDLKRINNLFDLIKGENLNNGSNTDSKICINS
jgi:hypothetical protein